MNANEIDRALREDPAITPSPAFAVRVMGAVRRQAAEHGALSFPWRRLIPGLAACAVVTVVSLALAPPPAVPEVVVRAIEHPAAGQTASWVTIFLLGTWMLVWFPLRLAGFRR
jgi:hypothetical protein